MLGGSDEILKQPWILLLFLGFLESFRKLSEMWHPHVYANPPQQPTPFSIDDILQPKSEQQSQETPLQIQQNNLLTLLGANQLMNFPFAQVKKDHFTLDEIMLTNVFALI